MSAGRGLGWGGLGDKNAELSSDFSISSLRFNYLLLPIYKLKVWLCPTMTIAGCTLLGILGWISNEMVAQVLSSPHR